ncbi:hypothetical protein E1A91_A12G150800v1, partial [Gossypium mustelinum]
NGTGTTQTKPLSKDTKKKDVNKKEDLHAQLEEDLALKQQLELYIERIYDVDPEVQKAALKSMRQEVCTSISSMTYVPKLLKFLRPHYGTLKAFYETMLDSDLKGNGYVRILPGEIPQEYLMRQSEDAPVDDLMKLMEEIAACHMKHNTESEAVDLLIEVDDLEPLTEHVDITNFRRTCLYLTSAATYLLDSDDILFMDIVHSIYLMFYEFSSHVCELFTSCNDLLMKKQFCYILARQGINFELNDDMVEDDRELSQNIINNVKLSEGYLTLAHDFEVMEPKYLENIYKVWTLTLAGQNLVATFDNAFVNAGFGKDTLMTDPTDSSSDGLSKNWIFKNKEHAKISVVASLDVDSGLAQTGKYLHSDHNYVIAKAFLGAGLVNCSALALLSEYINKKDSLIQIGAIMGLGIAYAGAQDKQVSQAIADTLTGRTMSELRHPKSQLLVIALGLIYLGKQKGVEATSEVSKLFSEKMKNYVDITLLSCAHAGTGNILTVQKLLGHCSHLENAEASQGFDVLGIAIVAMAEEVGLEISIRSLKHLLQYSEQKIRRAVPLALGLLCISNPKVNMMDTLSRLSHDTDLEVAMVICAGTNNARIDGMLRNLPSFSYRVRIAQGLVHMVKGLLTLNPYHSDRRLCSPTALAGLVTMLHACLDMKSIILGKYHFVLYYLVLAMKVCFSIPICYLLSSVGMCLLMQQVFLVSYNVVSLYSQGC